MGQSVVTFYLDAQSMPEKNPCLFLTGRGKLLNQFFANTIDHYIIQCGYSALTWILRVTAGLTLCILRYSTPSLILASIFSRSITLERIKLRS